MNKFYKILLTLFAFCLFTSALQSQWQQLPNLPVSGSAYSVAFINKDTGYVSMDTPALLRTTNGGQSWVMVGNFRIYNLQFVDSVNGFGSGKRTLGSYIIKTTDGGFSWDSVSIDPSNVYLNLFFVNKDTGWVGGGDGSLSKIWRTTNGGVTLQVQNSGTGNGNEKVFFLKDRINNQYYGWALNDPSLLRTTNSGVNWTLVYSSGGGGGIGDFYFRDTASGIMMRNNRFQKTTDSGISWTTTLEFGVGGLSRVGMIDSCRGWITLGQDTVLKTNNFFQSYGKQKHFAFSGAGEICVIDSSNAYTASYVFGKTTNGGGNIVSVTQISSEVPQEYSLFQNYPNPFNPMTNFGFRIADFGLVKLIIYDVIGREVSVLINKEMTPGIYEVNWDASNLPSGIYIYKLITGGFTAIRKAVLIK